MKRSRIAACKRFIIVHVQGFCTSLVKNLALCVGCRLPTADTNSQSINVVNLKIAFNAVFRCEIANFTQMVSQNHLFRRHYITPNCGVLCNNKFKIFDKDSSCYADCDDFLAFWVSSALLRLNVSICSVNHTHFMNIQQKA